MNRDRVWETFFVLLSNAEKEHSPTAKKLIYLDLSLVLKSKKKLNENLMLFLIKILIQGCTIIVLIWAKQSAIFDGFSGRT